MLKIKPLYLIAIVLITAFATWKLTLLNRYPSAHVTLLTVKRLDSSLTAANEIVRRTNHSELMAFDNRMKDVWLAEKAAIWLPIMRSAIESSDGMFGYIETVKSRLKKEAGLVVSNGEEKYHEDDIDAATRLMITQEEGKKLMDSLKKFSASITVLLPELARKKVSLLPVANTLAEPAENYFKDAPAISAIAILSKFQNDILRSGNIIVDFCSNQSTNHVIIVDDFIEPLVTQNSINFIQGQMLEITAGLGAFSNAPRPVFTINGQKQEANGNGLVFYKIKVAGSSGSIPISVSYTDPNTGQITTRNKQISYTVRNH
jgi:hypothetical protein